MIHAIDRHRSGRDAHGRAALTLVESLIHTLVAKSVLGSREAIELVSVAAEAEAETAAEFGDPSAVTRRSVEALDAIRHSLAQDLP